MLPAQSSTTEPTALCYHCDALVNYDLTTADALCNNCGLSPYHGPADSTESYILICQECRRLLARTLSSHMSPAGISYNCPRCDPSTNEVKYSIQQKNIWVTSSYRTECIRCHDVDFASQNSNMPRFCKDCNPSDDHNRYEYRHEVLSYHLTSIYSYFSGENKHRWISPYPEGHYDCPKCGSSKRFSKEDKNYVKYDGDTASAVVGTSEISTKGKKKIRFIVEAPDYSALPMEGLAFYLGAPLEVAILIYEYCGTTSNNSVLVTTNPEDTNIIGKNIGISELGINHSGSTLNHLNLNRAQYMGFILVGSSFIGADLTKANFERANLEGVNFMGAILKGVSFKGSKLDGANFVGADLTDAQFPNINFTSVNFGYTRLIRTNFSKCTFNYVSLAKCRMRKTIFKECKMQCVSMHNADIAKCNFSEVNISNSILSGIEYKQCDFSKGKFDNCRLTNSSLAGNDLQKITIIRSWLNKANLSQANLTEAKIINTHCDNAVCEDTIFIRAHITGLYFKSCNFTRAKFDTSIIERADMRRALLDEASFDKTKLGLASIEDADTLFKGAILVLDRPSGRRRR